MEDITSTTRNGQSTFWRSGCLIATTLLAAAITGCAQPAVDTAAAITTPPMPIDRSADHYEWIKRLQATTPAENVPQVATPGSQMSYPIPVPMSAGAHYALVVNQSLRMAWLQSSNGTMGPWPLDQPDVTHLLKSVAIPPTNSVAAQ